MRPGGGTLSRPAGRRALILVALFLSALSLRPPVIGVGPLLPRIQLDLGAPHGIVGLLGTIPVLCMGIFAPAAAFVSGRLGSRRAVTVCLLAIGGFGLVRAAAPGTSSLLLATFGVGVPIGIAGALLPVAVKERFADRPVLATGVYASGIQLGAAGSAIVAVPIAQGAGGWRGALAALSAVVLVLAVAWLALAGRGSAPSPRWARPPRLPLRSGVAWLLTTVFLLQSIPYYGLNAWTPAYLIEAGWTESTAGALLGLSSVMGLTATLLIPVIADRGGSRRSYIIGGAGLVGIGTVGLLLAPGAAPVWMATAGFGLGTLFPVVLTLPLDVSTDPSGVGAVAGMMLGVGYATSALTPSVLGFVRDATGSFAASLWLIVAVCAVLAAVAATLSPTRLGRGVRSTAVIPPAA